MYPANNDTKARDDKQIIKDIQDRIEFGKQYEQKSKQLIKYIAKIESKLQLLKDENDK